MKRICTLALLITTALTPASFASAGAIPVSPGGVSSIAPTSERCTNFSWAPARDAHSQRIVVFEIAEGSALVSRSGNTPDLGSAALDVELPAAAASWTPPANGCLQGDREYAWVVGTIDGNQQTTWSSPSFFSVPAGPSSSEIASALEVLRQAAAAGLLPGSQSLAPALAGTSHPPTVQRTPEEGSTSLTLATATAAINAELADLTGEAVGVIAVSNSPDGAGLIAANADPTGGADLVLDGSSQSATDAVLTESGIDRDSATDETFNVQNSGAGSMTLQVDGDTVLAGDSSVGTDELANGSVTLNKLALSSVDSQRIVDFSIGPADLAPDSVTFTAIQADAVRSIDIKDGEISDQDISGTAGIDISKLDLVDKIDGIHLEDVITLDAALELLSPSDVKIVLDDAVLDDVSTALTLRHNTSGTAADGIGTSLRFVVEDPSNLASDSAEIIAKQDTFSPRASSLTFKTFHPPKGAPQETFKIDGAGDVNVVNDLIVGGTISVGAMSIDTSELADGSVTEAKLATSVAGDGLTGGEGSPLAVSANDGSISVTADGIAVGLASDTQVADDLTVDGGAIDDSPIGSTTASSGAFTTLTTSGSVTLGNASSDGITVFGRIGSNLIPSGPQDLGSSTNRWDELFLSGSTLHLGSHGNEATIDFNTSADRLTFVGAGEVDFFQADIKNSSGASPLTVADSFVVEGVTDFFSNVTLGNALADQITLLGTLQGGTPLTFEGASADGFETTIAVTDPTADRTITFPNATGMVQLAGGNLEGNGTLTIDGGTTTIDAAELNVLDSGLDAGEVSGTNSQNLFATIDAPNGTDPIADTTSDTLLLVEGSAVTITGNAASDGISIGITDDAIDGAQLADSITLDAATTISGANLTLGSDNRVIINDVLRLTPRSAAPTCTGPISASIYYDSDDDTFCFCEGGTWTPLDGAGACS